MGSGKNSHITHTAVLAGCMNNMDFMFPITSIPLYS